MNKIEKDISNKINDENKKNNLKDAVIILNTGSCTWGKCLFCGWGKLEFPKKSFEELKVEFLEKYRKLEKSFKNSGLSLNRLKLYCSGSFLDEQVPEAFIEWLLNFAKEERKKGKLNSLLLEAKINDFNEEKLKKLNKLKEDLELYFGIGLEVADDDLIKKLLKDFASVEKFEKQARLAKKYGIKLRIYTLVNAPYDKNIIETTKKTLKFASKFADEIVVINAYPHKDAGIFWLWYYGKWKPLNKGEFKEIIRNSLKELISGNFSEKIKDIENLINEEKIEEKILLTNNEYGKVFIEFDYSNYYFIPKFPKKLIDDYKEKSILKGAKEENLVNRVYKLWEDYLLRFYEPKEELNILFLIPCAARKPYFLSKTHKLLKKNLGGFQIFKKMHWVVISNPGVIPYEFITKWPFAHYDWPEWEENNEIQEKYFKITKNRIKKYLLKHGIKYKYIIAFFKPRSLTRKAVEEVIEELNLKNKCLILPNENIWDELIKEGIRKPLFSEKVMTELRENMKELQKKLN